MIPFKSSTSLLALCLCCFHAAGVDGLRLVPQVPKTAINSKHDDPSTNSNSNKLLHYTALPSSRRDAIKNAFVLTTPFLLSTFPPLSSPANALEQCKPKSHNCIRTTWTAPSSLTTPSEVATIIRDVLNSYPQDGQAGVDCNGYKIVKDTLDGDTGIINLEYKSCVGPAALAINFGQPFIDDLKLELNKQPGGNFLVEVKSSSRMGSSDLFVNRKRLEYLGKKLKGMGWGVPDPKYVYELKK